MNEIALSDDLKQIELEINHHKNIAGQSIWEIGRRLNHVKENDLAHGQFIVWLESIGFTRQYANRFMKIAKELPNVNSSLQVGVNKLYLIATLPDEEAKEDELKKVEDGNPSTDMELKELKKRLNQQEEKHHRELKEKDKVINKSFDQIQELQNKKPEVVEKEVVPDDYEYLKENNVALSKELKRTEYEAKTVREAYDHLIAERKEEDEGSRKYQELSQAIQDMEGQMSRQQKRIQSQKQVYDLVDKSKDLLQAITPIPYLLDEEFVRDNPVAKRELEKISTQTAKFLKYLNDALEKSEIIEGVIINE